MFWEEVEKAISSGLIKMFCLTESTPMMMEEERASYDLVADMDEAWIMLKGIGYFYQILDTYEAWVLKETIPFLGITH